MIKFENMQAEPTYYGTVLQNGSSGPDVALVQSWLNGTPGPCNPGNIAVDGKFGSGTQEAVRDFQKQAGLAVDGKVGQNSWNALYSDYAARHGEGEIYPGIPVRSGNRGATVQSMQQRLSTVRRIYTAIPDIQQDGKFGSNTAQALEVFQMLFGLTADSVMGQQSFATLMSAYLAYKAGNPMPVLAPYGGTVLQSGSSGNSVRIAQSFLAAMGGSVSAPTIDGKFGSGTERATKEFQQQQGLTVDGKIGKITWTSLKNEFNSKL